ncbi:hypothetical protein M422DRAFT_270976 [Sphaerobolus stellatus SS14]|uniref:Uncharacterized protein n=1 Tax=Sphaerobolus stellatus (strain SS14) TaxID=990650 RepID=A0A0C9UR95_SPHS4|nr:hypothetical protein M422DRAFT_270976 [Sphaerobolus stellatus SS14]
MEMASNLENTKLDPFVESPEPSPTSKRTGRALEVTPISPDACTNPTATCTAIRHIITETKEKGYRLVVADYTLVLELLECVEHAVGGDPAEAPDMSKVPEPPRVPPPPAAPAQYNLPPSLSDIAAIVKASEDRIIHEFRQRSSSSTTPAVAKIFKSAMIRPKLVKSKDNEVNISLVKVAKDHPIRMSSPGSVKAIVEDVLDKAGIEDLVGMKIQGARIRPNRTLVINVLSDENTSLILRHSDTWVNALAPGSSVLTKSYSVVTNFVPVEFDPKEEGARRKVVGENRAVMEREDKVVGMRWLNGKGQGHQAAKRHSLLIITVNSAKLADHLTVVT